MTKRWLYRVVLAATLAAGAVQPGLTQNLAGAYLAARQADFANDFGAAAQFYAQASAQDPANGLLIQDALVSQIMAGDFRAAITTARGLETNDPGNLFSGLMLSVEAMRAGDYGNALLSFPDNPEVLTPLLQYLVTGWLSVGAGDPGGADKAFGRLETDPNLGPITRYNRALALAFRGDLETAARIMAGDGSGPLNLNRASVLAHAQILAELNRADEAVALLEDVLNSGVVDPEITALRDRVKAGDPVKFDQVTEIAEPIAATMVLVAQALGREAPSRMGLIYSRFAAYLWPSYDDALLTSADFLAQMGQHQLAADSYKQIVVESPNFISAQAGRAEALRSAGDVEGATAVLVDLAVRFPENPDVLNALGDVYRGQERYAEARAAYDRAIDSLPQETAASWIVYYTRGICNERLGDWDLANADFRHALELSPGQPWVLNYLGYSLVEKGESLTEAQDMIRQAVEQMPNNGYIVDSLAWVLYKLGKYQEAVPHMERAAELLPVDPIINDHLGDILWAVDRKREAVFHWKRALSFGPDEAEIDRIRRKLEVGLDQVLKEEARVE